MSAETYISGWKCLELGGSSKIRVDKDHFLTLKMKQGSDNFIFEFYVSFDSHSTRRLSNSLGFEFSILSISGILLL